MFLRDRRGVAVLEYVLIGSMVAVVIAVVATSFDLEAGVHGITASVHHLMGRR